MGGERSRSGGNLLEGESGNGHAFPGVLDGYGAEAAIAVQVQKRVFVQVSRLIHIGLVQLDVQSVRTFKVSDFHGLKDR